MITKDEIKKIRTNIARLVQNQLVEGNQKKLFPTEIYTCGQWINMTERNQRGIHGTAGALRVLADIEENRNPTIIKGLFLYLSERTKYESEITQPEEKIDDLKITRDEKNVIKIGEILNALSFVKSEVNTHDYVEQLKAKLINSVIRFNKDGFVCLGWSFFIDNEQTKIEMLPTAFAIFGLARIGYDVTEISTYFKREIKSYIKKDITDPIIFSEIVFCLYVLTYINKDISSDKDDYCKLVKKLFRSQFCSLGEDYEQNIEYWYNANHDYVRIPWQLYFIATTSKISPRFFSKLNTQRRLSSIKNQGLNGGFKYPNSGPYLSTRTNAILYSTLAEIQDNLDRKWLYGFYYVLDKIRNFLGSDEVRTLILVTIVVIFGYDLIWFIVTKNIKQIMDEMGPHIMFPILFFLYEFGKKRKN